MSIAFIEVLPQFLQSCAIRCKIPATAPLLSPKITTSNNKMAQEHHEKFSKTQNSWRQIFVKIKNVVCAHTYVIGTEACTIKPYLLMQVINGTTP